MLQPLRERNYLLFWLAQFISSIGDVFYSVGVMVTIFQLTGSTLQTAGAMIATTLPLFLLGPIAGPVVDRYPRQRVMLLMDLGRIVLVGSLLLVVRSEGFNTAIVYAVVAGLSAAKAFYLPARQAIIPALVERPQVVAANSLVLSTTQATNAIGYILGGFLILKLSFEAFVLFDLLTFALAGGLVALIRIERPAAATARPLPWWRALREGAGYLRRHRIARPLVIMEVLEHIPHGIWTAAIMLAFVTRSLGGNADDWGLQSGVYFAGNIVGSLIAGVLASRLLHRAGRVVIANAFLSGVLTLAYSISPTNLIATLLAFAFGPPMAIRDVAQDSLLQLSVDEAMLGRIFAIRHMFLNLSYMVAGLFFAGLADLVNPRYIYAVGGLLYLGTTLFAAASKGIRSAELRPGHATPG